MSTKNMYNNKPFVFINTAMSADGKIASIERRQTRISNKLDLERVDELRAISDGVMIGIGTMLSDNPSLTVKSKNLREKRLKQGKDENPVRIVVDSYARTPIHADIFKKGAGKRIIAVSEDAPQKKVDQLAKYAEIITTGREIVDLKQLLSELKKHGINTLMVEGGATLNWGLISLGLVDEIYTYIGNLILGGSNAPTLVDGKGFLKPYRLELISLNKLDQGVVIRWRVCNKV